MSKISEKISILSSDVKHLLAWLVFSPMRLVPQSIRSVFTDPPNVITVEVGDDSVTVGRYSTGLGGSHKVGDPVHLGDINGLAHLIDTMRSTIGIFTNIQILIPQNKCFSLTRKVPSRAVDQAGSIIQLEMERVAPFSSDQMYSNFYVDRENLGSDNLLNVSLYAVKKQFADPIISAVAKSGIALHSVRVIDNSGALLPINLVETNKNSNGRKPYGYTSSKLMLTLVLACLVLGGLFVVTDSWLRVAKLNQLERELDGIRNLAMTRTNNVNRLRSILEGVADLRSERNTSPRAVEIWNETSRVLPLHSWLESIEVNGQNVQINGQSKSASSLIRVLEQSPIFQNVEFNSPIALDPISKLERFEIKFVTQKVKN